MKKLKWLSLAFLSLTVLAIIVAGSWTLTESAIQATSDTPFCSVYRLPAGALNAAHRPDEALFNVFG